MSDSLEKATRAVLVGLPAVTAIVGQKIRPHKLGQKDRLPAILIEVPTDETAECLGNSDPQSGQAVINVVCCAHTKAEAHAIAEAVRTNGTDPGTGLSGYSGAAGDLTFDSAALVRTECDLETDDGDGDEGDWYLEIGVYRVWWMR